MIHCYRYYICDSYRARLTIAALTEFKIAADFAVKPTFECLTTVQVEHVFKYRGALITD